MKNKCSSNQCVQPPCQHNGFTLVEVLTAMIIVSVGLLGIAGLVVESQKSAFEVYQRSTALELGKDLLGRINANPSALNSYQTNLTAIAEQPETLCSAVDSNCTKAQMATYDLWLWGGLLYGNGIKTKDENNASGLVEPMACISVDGANLTVSIVWRGKFPQPDKKGTVTCGDDEDQYKLSTKNDLRRVMTLTTRVG